MASKDKKMGKKCTAGNMMNANSTVTQKPEMTSMPKSDKNQRELMASYA
jgi:hypothetical protein